MDRDPRAGAWIDDAMLLGSVAVPLLVVASRASAFADAAHDEAVVRALGLGWTGVWRALDVPVSSLFLALPFGTRALRASLVGAVLGGVGGVILYQLGKRLLGGPAESRARLLVAGVASACASLSGAWLIEASSAGSSLLGVVLVLAPVVLATSQPGKRTWPLLAGLLAAALTYEPLVGLVACAGALAGVLRARKEARATACGVGFAVGCLPFAVALACRHLARHRLDAGLFGAWAGEGVPSGSAALVPLVLGELGFILPALAVAGALQVLADRRLRATGGAVVAMGIASALAVSLGAPAGSEHWSAPALTLLGSIALLAAVPMHGVVVAVARARLPLASASAAMVVVLELTFPVLTLDEGLQRLEARAPEATPGAGTTRSWDDVAFESLPAGSLLLVADPRLYARALASLATGELRADLTIVPTFDVSSEAAQAELSEGPSLSPLWRDLVLYGAPRERTLTSVASTRPLVVAFEPSWERGILRHLVPVGLLASFHPEPRGAGERLLALAVEAPWAEGGGGALEPLTARLLEARAKSLLNLGEREAAAQVEGSIPAMALPFVTGERRPRRLLTWRGSRVTTSL